MDEQQGQTTATATTGDKWGDAISEERQRELAEIQAAWDAPGADHGNRKGPFDQVRLTGAEVAWLADQSRPDDWGRLYKLHLEGAKLIGAHLEGAVLVYAHLEGANLESAHLEGADLERAHLQKANLVDAHLEKAAIYGGHLEGANLADAHLEGADLVSAHLKEADLTRASFDKATRLNLAVFTGALLEEATFDNTNLSVVDWRAVPMLGDELQARTEALDEEGHQKPRNRRLTEYSAAVRAYRRLAVALQTNGLSDAAARYNYRAQICQRKAYFLERRFPEWFGSWVLTALAGYGFRPMRTIFWYLATIAAFAVAYFFLGPSQGHVFHWYGALIFSVTSFHGRGFFPENLSFESWVTGLAALEAVLGLLIEISFIATFTQRFFNAR